MHIAKLILGLVQRSKALHVERYRISRSFTLPNMSKYAEAGGKEGVNAYLRHHLQDVPSISKGVVLQQPAHNELVRQPVSKDEVRVCGGELLLVIMKQWICLTSSPEGPH